MNSPFVLEQSKAIVDRPEIGSVADASRRIVSLYRLIFAREPSADELKVGVAFVTQTPQPSRWEAYAQVLMLTNEFAFVD
jgi:hypothetical protein